MNSIDYQSTKIGSKSVPREIQTKLKDKLPEINAKPIVLPKNQIT
jgi:hypothetical protein